MGTRLGRNCVDRGQGVLLDRDPDQGLMGGVPVADFEAEGRRPGKVGARRILAGYDDEPVAVIEITESRVVPAAEIDESFARDEGENFESVEDWRLAHERFFDQPIEPDTQIVAVRFRVVERL